MNCSASHLVALKTLINLKVAVNCYFYLLHGRKTPYPYPTFSSHCCLRRPNPQPMKRLIRFGNDALAISPKPWAIVAASLSFWAIFLPWCLMWKSYSSLSSVGFSATGVASLSCAPSFQSEALTSVFTTVTFFCSKRC